MEQKRYQFIRLSESIDCAVTLTLNRTEKKNVLSIALRDEVTEALAALAESGTVKAVILNGAGMAFPPTST